MERTVAERTEIYARGATMSAESNSLCKSCQSDKGGTFNGEIALHFPGLRGLNKPIVWAFPKVAVCLNCGLAEFVVSEQELQVLATGKRVDGAIVSESQRIKVAR